MREETGRLTTGSLLYPQILETAGREVYARPQRGFKMIKREAGDVKGKSRSNSLPGFPWKSKAVQD